MASISNLSLYSHPKVTLGKQRLLFAPMASGHRGRSDPVRLKTLSFGSGRRCSERQNSVVTAAYGAEGGTRRRVYRQSQAELPSADAPVKQIASFAVPAGVFLAVP
ncbi:hypothetical protein SLE2022_045310 [Rubroshorea leprosula]